MIVSVLVCREGTQWVAQALEGDMATQHSDSMLAAVDALGGLFDARDHIVEHHERDAAPLPRTSQRYWDAYAAGDDVGDVPLGDKRTARVRFGVSPYALEGGQ